MSTADRYREAGVDLDRAVDAKRRIAESVASTRTDLSTGLLGAFGGMLRLPEGISDPNLVMSTDGVGTKVLVAIRAGRHDTVGEDLVNHCVDDILVHGARPLAFLDYIASADVETDTVAALVEGVARGCREHGMTLVGGETAQLPELYHSGHYDLAGTIVGVVSEAEALHGDRVQVGDVLLAYASSGLHTNGYTLARKILFDAMGLNVDDDLPGVGQTVAEALLAVHRSYWKAVRPVLPEVHALAHITGGGIPGNLSRSLPDGCSAVVHRDAWEVPALFRVLQEHGRVSEKEMYHVFNMGVGLIAVLPSEHLENAGRAAEDAGVMTWQVGEVRSGDGVQVI
ncbi:MAG: phosphoribosylformylglycinamidine cyclo-ligase [Gemmatimonadota bacterium]